MFSFERLLIGDFKGGGTITVDSQNGEMAFTTELPEDGGEVLVPVSVVEDGGETPSIEDQDAFDKLVGE